MDLLINTALYLTCGMLWLNFMFWADHWLEEEEEWCTTMKVTTVLLWPILSAITVSTFTYNFFFK